MEENQCKMTSYVKYDDLVILAESEKQRLKHCSAKNIRLRLCGGGEDSLNNGTSGWGQVRIVKVSENDNFFIER
jgi:trinucleotide repeat-containing gene 6 protein